MENNKLQLIDLLNQKNMLLEQLDKMVYGAVEVREKGGNQYIYTHTRERGLRQTRYIGEYNVELQSLIESNNVKAKKIKKQIRAIEKQLAELQFNENELSDKVKLNIDFAKRNMVDTIYKQAVLEGIAVTFVETETIVENGKINNVLAEDVQKINNLKHAWQLILDRGVLCSPSDYNLLCLINKLVEEGFYFNAGKLRAVPVAVSGTNWRPDLPIESVVKEELGAILQDKNSDVYQKAINCLLYVMRKQIFIDGNKRTAVIFANHILISAGAGLIAIPENCISEYRKLLIDFYETNNSSTIAKFIADNCLTKI